MEKVDVVAKRWQPAGASPAPAAAAAAAGGESGQLPALHACPHRRCDWVIGHACKPRGPPSALTGGPPRRLPGSLPPGFEMASKTCRTDEGQPGDAGVMVGASQG